jgi:hypothetical protein
MAYTTGCNIKQQCVPSTEYESDFHKILVKNSDYFSKQLS